MAKDQFFVMDAVVLEAIPGAKFEVELLKTPGKKVVCTLAGKMRVHSIKILPGDYVKVEVSIYNLEQGRISYRYRDNEVSSMLKEYSSSAQTADAASSDASAA